MENRGRAQRREGKKWKREKEIEQNKKRKKKKIGPVKNDKIIG
jgi:hypothetical protein